MKLSIIVVNYKSYNKTQDCLNSVFANDLSNLSFEIIVVNNSPREDIEDRLNEEFSQVKLINSSKNLGMGGGNNLGIKNSRGEYLLILNPDTKLYKNIIKTLVNYLESNPEVSIVGPKLINPDETLQYSCARFPNFYTPIVRRTFLRKMFKSHINWFLMKDVSHDKIMKVDWLMGSCLLIRKEPWTLFDERYFMYFEDIDLCRQAKSRGREVVYNPQAKVIHDHSRESADLKWYDIPFRKKIVREHIKSWLKYFIKWKLNFKN